MNTKATDINVNTPVHQQTFTLPPHSPTVFSNISPLQTILKGAPSTLSPLSDMFHATGTGSTLFDTNLSTTSNNALGDGTVSKSSSITGTPRDISMIADANPTSLGTFQTKRPTDFTTNLLTASMKETTRGIPFNATSTSKPSLHLHTGSPESTAHLHTPKVTVTTVSPQTVTNDRLNLIVGDWTGADQHLTQPPKPSPVVDHTHDHNHVHSHVHGFTEPAIPRPPPLPTDAISNNGISGTTGSSSSLGFHSLKQNLESFGQNTAKESTGNTSNAAMGNVLGLNIADSTTGRSTKDMGLNIGPGNLKEINVSFKSILDQTINHHIGKYQSALVYLFDPHIKSRNQSENLLDVVEIALNLTDPAIYWSEESNNSMPVSNHSYLSKSYLQSPILSLNEVPFANVTSRKATTTTAATTTITTTTTTTGLPPSRTQIDSRIVYSTNRTNLNPTTPIYYAAQTNTTSNSLISTHSNTQEKYKSNETITIMPSLVSTLLTNYSVSDNTSYALSANTTSMATSVTLTAIEMSTMAGSTTMDPDYLADLAEAREEAAQLAAELAEAGEITLAMTTMQPKQVPSPTSVKTKSKAV